MNVRYALPIATLLSSLAIGQVGPGGNAGAPVPSTAVNPDGTVTFSISAPNASTVRLSASYPIVPGAGFGPQANRSLAMTRDERGVWSITVGPLAPELYNYGFVVDGISLSDPRAIFSQNGRSVLFVHGPASANYEMSDVPHGTVSAVWYESTIYQGVRRRLVVYTPPGYETSRTRYPVLYLLHGGGGDELTWADAGRAPAIFDNLIAQRRMMPSIVVMSNGTNRADGFSARDSTLPRVQGSTRAPLASGNPRELFLSSLINEILPFVDRTYRTRADRDHRAVAGYSGGGGESMVAAMNHPDKFSWVGAFSPAIPDVPAEFNVTIPKPVDAEQRRGPGVGSTINPQMFEQLVPLGPDVNRRLHLLYLAIGDVDGLLEAELDTRRLLDSKGIKYQWVQKHDYGHEFSMWRINLQEFASEIFQPDRDSSRTQSLGTATPAS